MKTIRQTLLAFTAAMLFTSSAVFAQLKVGTNPTTIGANSNLEVEASTAGRKLTVDKTTGQLTVADGTQGAGKVLTSDANGGASWQTSSSSGSVGLARITVQGFGTGGSVTGQLKPQNIDVNNIAGFVVDPATGVITLPAGTYHVGAYLRGSVSVTNPGNVFATSFVVNGVVYQHLGTLIGPTAGTAFSWGGSTAFTLTATTNVWFDISCTIASGSGTLFNLNQGFSESVIYVDKVR